MPRLLAIIRNPSFSTPYVLPPFPKIAYPELSCQGYAHSPYEWASSTVDIQMLRVGNLVMLIIPGKFMLPSRPKFTLFNPCLR
jgi:hypothetical protein